MGASLSLVQARANQLSREDIRLRGILPPRLKALVRSPMHLAIVTLLLPLSVLPCILILALTSLSGCRHPLNRTPTIDLRVYPENPLHPVHSHSY